MKTILSFVAILCFCCAGLAQTDTTRRPYYIRHCRITYQFQNGPQKGTRTAIFDDWGQFEKAYVVTETDTSFFSHLKKEFDVLRNDTAFLTKMFRDSVIPPINNIAEKQSEIEINTPTYVYRINPDTKQGAKIARNISPMALQMDSLLRAMVGSQKKMVGHEMYLGKACRIEIIDGVMKMWMWNGVCLKKVMLNPKGDAKFEEYATEIDETYMPTKADFEPPKDIVIREY